MNILKKISILGISVGIMFGPVINTYAESFLDLPRTHWAYESVQWGVGKDLVKGYEDGTYKPASQITEEEFASVLARYVKDIDNSKLAAGDGVYWSQPSYDELAKYSLPLKGNTDKVAKKTGLSRGRIAQLIAAKNGFNLDERQAIYYMYENDISYGLIDGTLSYESYGKDKAVDRAQIPAFFQRLEEKGHTTFMGKPSPVKDGTGIAGIKGVPKDKTEITDKDFQDISDKVNPPVKGDFAKFDPIAKKYGYVLDGGEKSFSIRIMGEKSVVSFSDKTSDYGTGFTIRVDDYNKNKPMFIDVLKATGKLTESEIKGVINIIEVDHKKANYVPDQYTIPGSNKGVSPTGNAERGYSITIGIPK